MCDRLFFALWWAPSFRFRTLYFSKPFRKRSLLILGILQSGENLDLPNVSYVSIKTVFMSNISLDLQNRYKHVRVLHFQWLIDSFRLRFRHFRSYQTPNLKKFFKKFQKFYKIQSVNSAMKILSIFMVFSRKKLYAPNQTHFLPF